MYKILVAIAFLLASACNDADASQLIAANDSRITYIGRWTDTTDVATSTVPIKVALSGGERIRFHFTGTSLVANFDVFTTPTGNTTFEYAIDGTVVGTYSFQSASVTLATGLAAGSHTLDLWTAGMGGMYRWTTLEGLRVKTFAIDDGATMSAWPTGQPRMLTVGDSIASGDLVLNDGYSSGRLSFPTQLAALLGYENWSVAFGGTGFYGTQPANSVPATQINYLYKSSGVVRSDPDFTAILIEAIQNDGTTNRYTEYSTLVQQLKIDHPGVPIFCMGLIYPNPQEQTSVQSVAHDFGCTYLATSTWVYSHPATIHLSHPDVAGAAALAAYVQPIIASVVSPPTGTSVKVSTSNIKANFK